MSWHVDTSHCNLISRNFGLISHVCNVISCYLEITFHSCGMQGLQIDLFPRHKCKKKDIWMSDVLLGLQEYDISGEGKGTGNLSIKGPSFNVCTQVTCFRVLDSRGTDGRQVLPQQRERGVWRHNRWGKDEMSPRLQHYWAWRCSGSCKSKNRGRFEKYSQYQCALQTARCRNI